MGILDLAFEDDGRFAFADTDVFAESLTYKKKDGTTRTIKGVVHRAVPPVIDVNGVVRYVLLVEVVNDATYGIDITELDTGADKIAVAYRKGGGTRDLILGTPEMHDSGMLSFRILTSSY